MKKILILTFTNLARDARVRRQASMLKNDYQVTIACTGDNEKRDYQVIILKGKSLTFSRKIFLGVYLLVRWFSKAHSLLYPFKYLAEEVQAERYDLIIANDVESLPLAFQIASQNRSKVLFDAHEYAPRHFEDRTLWKIFFQPMNVYLCKTFLSKVDGMLTIGKGLAEEYQKHFPVNPVIITNANRFFDLRPTIPNRNSIKLVHHGIATPSRKLESMIEMMAYLDSRFTLDMYLVSEGFNSKKTIQYPDKLKTLAAATKRVRILPPIESEKIVTTINEYDIGVFLIPPVNFNYANTLPNKLFDFIQARLAIAIGPTPEMASIVKDYAIGIVAKDFSPQALAIKLNQLTHEQLCLFKENTMLAASQLNAEKNKDTLLSAVEGIIRIEV